VLFFIVGRKLFYIFLQQEHSEENLQFWNEVNHLKEIVETKEKAIRMKAIYKEFIKPMALKEVQLLTVDNSNSHLDLNPLSISFWKLPVQRAITQDWLMLKTSNLVWR